jgi:hypothetical protein
MAKEERYVSPDGELVLVVVWEEADVTLGFEGSAWHTHGDILAASLGATVEQAVQRFVDDLLSDRSVIAIGSFDWSPLYIWVEDGSEGVDEDPGVRRRYWSGRRATSL